MLPLQFSGFSFRYPDLESPQRSTARPKEWVEPVKAKIDEAMKDAGLQEAFTSGNLADKDVSMEVFIQGGPRGGFANPIVDIAATVSQNDKEITSFTLGQNARDIAFFAVTTLIGESVTGLFRQGPQGVKNAWKSFQHGWLNRKNESVPEFLNRLAATLKENVATTSVMLTKPKQDVPTGGNT